MLNHFQVLLLLDDDAVFCYCLTTLKDTSPHKFTIIYINVTD
jgi:hypothetical protein